MGKKTKKVANFIEFVIWYILFLETIQMFLLVKRRTSAQIQLLYISALL